MLNNTATSIVFVAALGAGFNACATTQGTREFRLEEPSAGMGTVYVYRPYGYAGSVVKYDSFFNGQPAGPMLMNGYVRISTSPGTHTIVIKPPASCLANAQPEKTAIVNIKVGETLAYEFGFGWLGLPYLETRTISELKGRMLEQESTFKSAGAAPGAFNDVVILKSGVRVEGVKVAVTSDAVVVTYSDGRVVVLRKADVSSVKRGR